MKTPAYIFDQSQFIERLKPFADLRQQTRFKLLYSIKALPLSAILEEMLPYVDGFSASSLFEAQLAREVLQKTANNEKSIHITTPGFRPDELQDLHAVCDYISLNSQSQWQRFSGQLDTKVQAGLRVNTKLSMLSDERFDPCRKNSKLGVDIEQFEMQAGLTGLHFHTMFGSESIEPLVKNLDKIESLLADVLPQLAWINIGGGYVFNDQQIFKQFEDLICRFAEKYQLTIYFEPGKGIVNDAGQLRTSVIDLFEADGKQIAVLDTTVCHHPEVFEYQTSPALQEADQNGSYQYILAGCSCKSGDLFGEYAFAKPLTLGAELNFTQVGAYSFVKASRFNGINLPDIYLRKDADRLNLIKSYNFSDYQNYFS